MSNLRGVRQVDRSDRDSSETSNTPENSLRMADPSAPSVRPDPPQHASTEPAVVTARVSILLLRERWRTTSYMRAQRPRISRQVVIHRRIKTAFWQGPLVRVCRIPIWRTQSGERRLSLIIEKVPARDQSSRAQSANLADGHCVAPPARRYTTRHLTKVASALPGVRSGLRASSKMQTLSKSTR